MNPPPPSYHRTRIAPTPSGFLHLGNILSFSITAALAGASGAKILLRIDDLDRNRADSAYLEDIFETLDFLEIPWNEGPRSADDFERHYSQLHRMAVYNQALDQLSQDGLVFACSCSRRQLGDSNGINCNCRSKGISLATPEVNWRLVTENESPVSVRSHGGASLQAALPAEMHNFIVRKKDGMPSYQLASVLDDLFYGTDLVVRGQDLWPSTLAQHALAKALGKDDFKAISFYHHPLLTGPLGEKLSKSSGATSVRYLRQQGKNAAGIFTLAAQMLGGGGRAETFQQLADYFLQYQG